MCHYDMALLSTSGRISTSAFLLLFLRLASATFLIEFSMDRALFDGSEINEWWYSVLLFLYWPQFCLVARLLRNTGVDRIRPVLTCDRCVKATG